MIGLFMDCEYALSHIKLSIVFPYINNNSWKLLCFMGYILTGAMTNQLIWR